MTFADIAAAIGETLLMTVISAVLAYIIGLPVGVLLNVTSKKGIRPNRAINAIFGVIVNILRSVPCLIIIVICMPFTRGLLGRGTGEWYTIIIPLTIAAFGFVARMVEQSLNEVDLGEVEAIKSLGASNWQIITKVIIPEARSSLITGVAVVLVNLIGYTAFAYNIAAGGLISYIYSYYSRNTGDYYKSFYFWLLIVLVVVIVQLLQEAGLIIAKKLDKRKSLKS